MSDRNSVEKSSLKKKKSLEMISQKISVKYFVE